MPTPSTRTPVRIARGSYSNLNSSISDLQDGEIVYAEDQDKLYVKEGSSLVALTFTSASPTFTGAVTVDGGGNLIINAQGDLRLADSDSSNYVGFQSPGTVTSNVIYTLPAADGNSGEQLTTDGSGALSWSAAVNVAAASLSGTTMASNVVTSSLTTLGTLTGLTIDGDVTFTGASSNGLWDKSANAFVANVTGALTGNADTATTATNANHVSVADNESTNEDNLIPFIEDASATGNVGLESDGDFHYNPSTGRVTATQLAGTLQTAAQTNITSVGTLTGLTVAGNYAQTLTSDGGFTATAAGNHAISITGDANRSADTNTLISIHGKWNGTKVATIDFQAGDDTTNKDNGQIVFYTAAAGSEAVALTIAEDKSATFTGTVSDSKGDLRDIPANSGSSAMTLSASDAGKVVATTSGGWVIPTGLSAGNTFTLLNDSGSDQTINATALTTLYNTADGAAGNVKASTLTIAARGMATVWMGSGTVGYIQSAALTVS